MSATTGWVKQFAVVVAVSAAVTLNVVPTSSLPTAATLAIHSGCITSATHENALAGTLEDCPQPSDNARSRGADEPTQGGDGLLDYGGEPLLDTTSAGLTVHAVYWAAPGYAFAPGFETTMNSFLSDVASGSTGPTSSSNNLFAVASQYFEVTNGQPQFVQDIIHAGAPIEDSSPYPSSSCVPATGSFATNCQNSFEPALYAYLTSNGDPVGLTNEYVIFFPQSVEVCFAGTGACTTSTFNGFCAFHRAVANSIDDSSDLFYSVIPFDPLCGAQPDASGAQLATSQVSGVAHELVESITNPFLVGGWTGLHTEIADECVGLMAPQPFGASQWSVQEVFSDVASSQGSGGCVSTYREPNLSPFITTTHLASVVQGSSYHETFNASGGVTPYYWVLLSGTLPAGVSLVAAASPDTALGLNASSVSARVGLYPITIGLVTPGSTTTLASVRLTLRVTPRNRVHSLSRGGAVTSSPPTRVHGRPTLLR